MAIAARLAYWMTKRLRRCSKKSPAACGRQGLSLSGSKGGGLILAETADINDIGAAFVPAVEFPAGGFRHRVPTAVPN